MSDDRLDGWALGQPAARTDIELAEAYAIRAQKEKNEHIEVDRV